MVERRPLAERTIGRQVPASEQQRDKPQRDIDQEDGSPAETGDEQTAHRRPQ